MNPTLLELFDAGSGIELNKKFFKLVSWHGNEWAIAETKTIFHPSPTGFWYIPAPLP